MLEQLLQDFKKPLCLPIFNLHDLAAAVRFEWVGSEVADLTNRVDIVGQRYGKNWEDFVNLISEILRLRPALARENELEASTRQSGRCLLALWENGNRLAEIGGQSRRLRLNLWRNWSCARVWPQLHVESNCALTRLSRGLGGQNETSAPRTSSRPDFKTVVRGRNERDWIELPDVVSTDLIPHLLKSNGELAVWATTP